jgi:6,7-dimethyl-8-ribityllumazine synthase
MSSNLNLFKDTNNLNLPQQVQVVVVYTHWNAEIIDEMLAGCTRILTENNIEIKLLKVPGAIEIPFIIKQYWDKYSDLRDTKTPDAFIALGCVIKGETPHFDYVCQSVTQGITTLNTSIDVPTIYGIITVLNHQQALDRLGGKDGHKGEEAASTALEMISLIRGI